MATPRAISLRIEGDCGQYRFCSRRLLMRREITVRPQVFPVASLLAFALGAAAVGAVAIGALAIGRVAVDRIAIKRARIGKLEVDELTVRSLHVVESSGVAR
jgi:hypothetical protein